MGFACNFSSDSSTFSHVSPWASQVVLVVKNLPAKEIERVLDPWIGKFPWRRRWQPTPVFLPGESLGQRNLAGATVHGVAESDVCSNLEWRHVNACSGGGDYPHPCAPGHTNWVRWSYPSMRLHKKVKPREMETGTSPAVQCLRLCTHNAGGCGSDPR